MNINDVKYDKLYQVILRSMFDEGFGSNAHSLEHPSVNKKAIMPVWSVADPDFNPDRYFVFLNENEVFIHFARGTRDSTSIDIKINLPDGELEAF